MAERAKILTRRTEPPRATDVASWQMQMRSAMFESLDPDAIRAIVAGLVSKAKAGDMAAARLILSYAVGSPVVQVNHAHGVVPGPTDGPAPLPTRPSEGLPGSDLRIVDLQRRAALGQAMDDPRDRALGLE
jgi:hypothetical protein